MLKPKIKIILIGLSSLLFVGLVYSLFSVKPEIIADENLRVQEPELPSMKSQVERAINPNGSDPLALSVSQTVSPFDNQLVDKPVMSYREEIVSLSDGEFKKNSLDNEWRELPEAIADELVAENKEPNADLPTKTAAAESRAKQKEDFEAMVAQSVSPFRDDAIVQSSEGAQKPDRGDDKFLTFNGYDSSAGVNISESVDDLSLEQSSDEIIAPDNSGFLDLNQKKAMLKKGDQLIVDDINMKLGKYTVHAPEASEAEEVIVAKIPSTKPSVFSASETDQKLMRGDSKFSKQYRQTMTKLISINAKLRDADEKNVELQGQFEMAVSQNRQLAQIIRDIDIQIKAFTLTN